MALKVDQGFLNALLHLFAADMVPEDQKVRLSKIMVNPFNAESFFVQSTRTQIFLKTIQTLSCWYSLERSRGVLSDEYPFAKVSVIFRGFRIILYWPNKPPPA